MNSNNNFNETKISKSTISKALNHCYGVNSNLRERILNDYSHLGTRKNISEIDMYVIVPETPRYFWKCRLPKASNPSVKVKYNIITSVGDISVILHYLKEAEDLGAKVIVLVSPGHPEVEKEIERLSQGRLIIYLNSFNETKNTFFIGPDPIKEGEDLAELCIKHHPKSSRLLVLTSNSNYKSLKSRNRFSGFFNKIEGIVQYDIISIPKYTKSPSFPAAISRILNEYLQNSDFGSVVCFDGITTKVCSALRKLKNVTGHNALCFGFENNPQNEPFAESGILKAIIYSNFQEQLIAAGKAAEEYLINGSHPSSKYVFLPHYIKLYE